MRTKSNTILVKGDPIQKEGTAAAAMQPGHLVAIATTSDGGAKITYTKHSSAAAPASRTFVRERDWMGGDTSETIAQGERVEVITCRPGDEVYARVANGVEIATAGVLVESAGDGTVRAMTAGDAGGTPPVFAGVPIGITMEAVDNGDNDSPFVRIEVL